MSKPYAQPTAADLAYEAWVLRKEGRDDTAIIARLAYEAYSAPFVVSAPVPWDRLPVPIQHAWAVVVQIVRQHDQGQATCQGDMPVLSRTTGWFPWIPQYSSDLAQTPYAHRQVEIAREEWATPQRVDPRTLNPAMNVVDLWWRPVQEDAHA